MHDNRRFAAGLSVFALLLHGLSLWSIGAKYWWDTISYFELAQALGDPQSLRALYSGRFGLAYQHVMPGLPVLIKLSEALFGEWMWIALALFQSLMASLAAVFLARSVEGLVSRKTEIGLVALVALHPWYSAFHAAVLTESLSGSIVAFMAAVTIRAMRGSMDWSRAVIVVLAAATAGGQMRSYLAASGAGLALLLIFSRYGWRRPLLFGAPIGVAAASFFGFSVLRMQAGIEFFPPNVNAWMLVHAGYAAWDFNDRGRAALEGVVLDPAIRRKAAESSENLTFVDMEKMVADLVATGLSRTEAAKSIAVAARKVRTQSAEVMLRQIPLAMPSLGFQLLAVCCDPDNAFRRGMDNAAAFGHMRHYFRWNAGLDKGNYRATFATYVERYRAQQGLYSDSAIRWYDSRVGPHVRESPGLLRRSVGWMLALPPDVIVLLGMAGFALLSRNDLRYAGILIAAAGPVFAAALLATVAGDNRHAYPLFPLYFLGMTVMAEKFLASLARLITRSSHGALRRR